MNKNRKKYNENRLTDADKNTDLQAKNKRINLKKPLLIKQFKA